MNQEQIHSRLVIKLCILPFHLQKRIVFSYTGDVLEAIQNKIIVLTNEESHPVNVLQNDV